MPPRRGRDWFAVAAGTQAQVVPALARLLDRFGVVWRVVGADILAAQIAVDLSVGLAGNLRLEKEETDEDDGRDERQRCQPYESPLVQGPRLRRVICFVLRTLFRHFGVDRSDEPIAASGHRLDEAWIARVVTERRAQLRIGPRQHAVDHALAPCHTTSRICSRNSVTPGYWDR